MQVDSSSNTYSTAAYSNTGVSGLVSGLDTEGMVQSMLQPIQTKIDKQNAAKQQLEWKQEMYRDVITKINDFQDKYFSLTSDTCLRSNALFNDMTSESTSSAVEVIKNSSGNEITSSIQVAQLASASTLKSDKLNGKITINESDINISGSAEINVTLDGITKTITLQDTDTMNNLKTDIANAFGSSISITENAGEWTITAGIGQEVSLSGSGLTALGFDSETTKVSTSIGLDKTLSEFLGSKSDYSFEINGTTIELSGSDTIADVIDKIAEKDIGFTMSYNSISDSLSLTADNLGKGFDLHIKDDNAVFSELFKGITPQGGNEYTFDNSTVDSAFTAGKNAVVSIDGTVMERTSNIISYNGLTLEIKDTTGNYIDDTGNITVNHDGTFENLSGEEEVATISSSRNTEKIIETVKSFIEDYNSLIKELNEYTHEEATYREYDPLTSDQKKEMSEREIELWEEKAKTGLLRNDSAISNFLSNMRKAMYTNVGSKYVLSQVGIDSSSEWKDYGKLSIDEKKFEEALKYDPDGIIDLFNGTNGLAGRLNDICSYTANKSSSNKGELVEEAGIVGYASEKDNVIYNKILTINTRLSTLNALYETKRQSYWDKFNQMEVQLDSIQQQMSWLEM